MKTPLLTVLATLLSFGVPAKSVDVVLLGGQSNMQGIGQISALPPADRAPIPGAYFFIGNTFEALVPGKTKTSTRSGELGPEIGFARTMTQAGHPVYLIKYHASGMPLHYGWNRNKWEGGPPAPGRVNFYPGTDANDPATGKLYRAMRQHFQRGLAALEAQGHTPVVRGFLWMQGEQDAKHETSATTYAASLKQLRDRLASDLKTDSLPLVFGQVLPHPEPMARFTHRTEIRAQMAAADHRSGAPESIPLTRMVSTDTFSLKKDTVHYDGPGQIQLGKAMAEALLSLQTPPAK